MSTIPEDEVTAENVAEWLRDQVSTVSGNEEYGFFRTGIALTTIALLFLETVGIHYGKKAASSGVEFTDNLLRFFFVHAILGVLLAGIGLIIATAIHLTVNQLRKRFGIGPEVALAVAVGVYLVAGYVLYRIGDWSIRPILDKYVDDDGDNAVPITPTDD